MKRFLMLTMVPAAVMFMVSAAWATPGTPISGTPVGLEGDPGSIVAASGRTDAHGNFIASGLVPGRYFVFIFDRWGQQGIYRAVGVRAGLVGGKMQASAPILPARGRSYALDREGRRLTVTVPGRRGERRGQIRITVVEAKFTPPNDWVPPHR